MEEVKQNLYTSYNLLGDLEKPFWPDFSRPWQSWVLQEPSQPNTCEEGPQKAVDPCLDFLLTTTKGHLIVAACDHLGVRDLNSPLQLPLGIRKGSTTQQYAFLESVSTHVVENFTVSGSTLTGEKVVEMGNGVHNYATMVHW